MFEYYSAIKKEWFLPFAITQMNFKGITVNKISQRKDKYSLYGLSLKRKHVHRYKKRLVVVRDGVECGQNGWWGQRIWTLSYKVNKP